MLDWLRKKPRCPVQPGTKQWIETGFVWLVDELGLDRLLHHKTIIPTEEFLPNEYDYSEEGIEDLMRRVAGFMDIDPTSLRLSFFEEKPSLVEHEGPQQRSAGAYSESGTHFEIWLEDNALEDPAGVISILAHEIGHVILLGQERLDPEAEDHEEMTDLLTVFLGLGIFPANSALLESNWNDGQWSGWSVGRLGYLSMDIYGYAMALYTLARGDSDPDWAAYLRRDVRSALRLGIDYIRKTGDCEFVPALDGLRD